MLRIEPGNATLGARVTGVDLGRSLSDADFAAVLRALGQYGVLCFPGQPIEAAALRTFSARFGGLQAMSSGVKDRGEPGMPEVSILSNVVENGRPIGIPDAGQDWHTDMTYNRVMGFVNVLVAKKVPVRNGKVLGATEFANTQAAYEDLPAGVKARLADATATHDWNNFHDIMRRKGSQRPALTEAQRRERPPVSHPVFLTHPISGGKVIYVNPGFTVAINGLAPDESRTMLDFLFAHVLQPRYRYAHHWSVGDVLVWDHLGTWHQAVGDYTAEEHRLMKRCQVLADKVFEAAFLEAASRERADASA
ncbi:MAG: taurine dioxygenase [Betaproteobacteria bacterium RIFCSPLOWO2_02_64_14]|nr:MAG: taurine dioxygenase [Betaproteobacteria bacterium RIFCSPLOWO2_02_64_14]